MGTPVASMDRRRWRTLATLTGVTVLDNTESGVTTTLFPTIASALGLTTAQLGVLGALSKLVAVPSGPVWVWLAGRTSRRSVLAVATVAGGAFGVLGGFSHDFWLLATTNTAMAACIVGVAPLANAVIADAFDETSRARAVGYFYGTSTLLAACTGPALAQLSGVPHGWRYGLWVAGTGCVLTGILLVWLFQDPGVGAAEPQLANLAPGERLGDPVTLATALALLRIPTFAVLMASRLMSGQLLIVLFGVQFLVTERGFTNAVAALALIPYGVGYFLGALTCGRLAPVVDRALPRHGRVAALQAAQVLFAVAALFGTQLHYHSIAVYGLFSGLMGATQALNPGLNRPLVAAVVPPELRGAAFAIFLTVFDTVGWGVFALGAGRLAEATSLQAVFGWVLVVLMVVNAAWLTLLHVSYPRDRERLLVLLDERRARALLRR